MAKRTHRCLSYRSLLLACLAVISSCGRTAHDAQEAPSLPDPGGAPSMARAGASNASGSGGGSQPSLVGQPGQAGEPSNPSEPAKPAVARVSCQAADAPGEPCNAGGCWGTRCGVRFNLFCEAGTWVVDGSALAFELVCPPDNEGVYRVGAITSGACCGEWLPRNEPPEPWACELCPATAPQDGDACALPDDCSSHIDCFYDCCCYGTTTWAQCDGERWHVATDCSGK